MSHLRLFAALFAAAMMSACGGGSATGSSVPPIAQAPDGDTDPPPDPVGPALLSGSVGTLALAVSGKARHVVVTNEGNHPALALSVMGTEALPTGTTVDADCSTLAPGASCTLTIAPGTEASAAPMDTNAPPVTLSVAGSNTNVLPLAVRVVDFGSVYQGGAVFDIDDTTAATGSIGGKVLGLTPRDNLPWSIQDIGVPGTDSVTDGEANTRAIDEYISQNHPQWARDSYMAGACSESEEAGHTDWYLPAICELGYGMYHFFVPPFNVCGAQEAPTLPNNVISRLDSHLPGDLPQEFTSSTLIPSVLLVWTQSEDRSMEPYTWWIDARPPSYTQPYRCVRRLDP